LGSKGVGLGWVAQKFNRGLLKNVGSNQLERFGTITKP
jgi:hypothetical protein